MAGGSAPRARRASDAPDDAPASASGQNRRSARRVDVTWSVDCSTEDTFLYASIANISAIGIFVRTESPLEPGTELTLRFSPRSISERGAPHAAHGDNAARGEKKPLDENGDGAGDELVLRGVVQWVNHVRPGGDNPNPGMGIRFVDLEPAEREHLVEAVRSIAYLREEAAAN